MPKSCETRDYRRSRCHTEHHLVSVCLLRHLLASITYLAPYTAQCNAVRTTLSILHLQEPTVGFNRILVKTTDSFQGGKVAVMFLDTTATDRPGFLKQRGRLNVALSRARAAIYVIVNVKQWNKAKQSSGVSTYVPWWISFSSNRKCRVRIPPSHGGGSKPVG
ncbi:hypothetical protein BO85DRAFT_105318 [Aspergillus piperis CBS 112811]|uniref:DNA2/NAM7 helicase-like C-terminal domain-containing protein n=1 Tax=Aspergillus piperis CBS 112811 TaxID=1448313 RepID=A0A8G1QVY0_9EURO|nr:hypothetical protein BO85DRAFT_105318 [Aspergillus piperis CBS 112811]RAH54557.1 hypothetical protein BO85DRAFT_105318 [Aspergillus piperis CBS 112811]